MTELFPTAIIVCALGLLLAASLHDAAVRTIPDCISVAIAVAGLILAAQRGTLLSGIAIAALLLLLLGLIWLRGYIGGGDVKLIPAVALLPPPALVPSLVLSIALAGGVLALIYIVASRLVRYPSPGPRRGLLARVLKAEARRMRRRESMPYAVAIAAGAAPILFATFPG